MVTTRELALFRREFGQITPDRYDVAYSLQVHRLVERTGPIAVGRVASNVVLPGAVAWWEPLWAGAMHRAVAGTEDAKNQGDRGGIRGQASGSWAGRDALPTAGVATLQGIRRDVITADRAQHPGRGTRAAVVGHADFAAGRGGALPAPVRMKAIDRGQVSPAFAAMPLTFYRGVPAYYK